MAHGGMLKPVETHVRVMQNDGGMQCTGTSVTLDDQQFNVSRVHPKSMSNQDFYMEVVRPVVQNALAGQSYTVLFAGPANSGRSHTMYGTANTAGMLQHVAKELLNVPEAFSTMSGYKVNGDKISDLVTEEENVILKELPPPIGKVALGKSTLLTSTKDASKFIPTKRSAGDSCFVQFHVYRKLDNNTNRSAFATLSLVDLAAFTPSSSLAPDLQAFGRVIQQCKNGTGSENCFSSCRLATLMSSALLGAASVMCVGTLTDITAGQIRPATMTCLEFMSQLQKVQQVMTLVQIQPPSGFAESLRSWEDVKVKLAQNIQQAEEAGCHAVYEAAERQLRLLMNQGPKALTASDDVVAFHRSEIQVDMDKLNDGELSLARNIELDTQQLLKNAEKFSQEARERSDHVNFLEGQINRLQKEDSALGRDLDDFQLTKQMELEQVEASIDQGRQKRDRLKEERMKARKKRDEWEQTAHVHMDQIEFEGHRLSFEAEMAMLGKKRLKYEAALGAASLKAQEIHQDQRQTMERASRASIVESYQMQVAGLQAKVQGKTPAQVRPKPSTGGRYTPSRESATVSPSPITQTGNHGFPSRNGGMISPSPLKQSSRVNSNSNAMHSSKSATSSQVLRSHAVSKMGSAAGGSQFGASPNKGSRSYSNATNNALVVRSNAPSMDYL